jgi:ribonuclease D
VSEPEFVPAPAPMPAPSDGWTIPRPRNVRPRSPQALGRGHNSRRVGTAGMSSVASRPPAELLMAAEQAGGSSWTVPRPQGRGVVAEYRSFSVVASRIIRPLSPPPGAASVSSAAWSGPADTRKRVMENPLGLGVGAPRRRVEVVVLQCSASVDHYCQRLLNETHDRVFGMDCEWKPSFRQGRGENPAAVLQICGGELCVLIQLLQVKGDKGFPQSLRHLLGDMGLVKVGVNIGKDFMKLTSNHQLHCAGYHDVGWAGGRILEGKLNRHMGIRTLCESLFQLSMAKNKKVSVSNWASPHLTDQQVEYAVSGGDGFGALGAAALPLILKCRSGIWILSRSPPAPRCHPAPHGCWLYLPTQLLTFSPSAALAC